MFNKFAIGVDIEDISRFRKLDFSNNKHFYKKIFTENEIEYCISKSNIYQHFAVRFCAKEAFMKAIDNQRISPNDIEVFFKDKKPFIKWKDIEGLLSLSHDKDKAIAFVLLELK